LSRVWFQAIIGSASSGHSVRLAAAIAEKDRHGLLYHRVVMTKKEPLLSPLMLLFLLAMILANVGGNMYQPLLPLYLQDLGAGVGQVGLFFTLAAILPLTMQILGGWVSDSVGRLRAIAVGSVAGIGAYTVLLLAPTWQWLLAATAFGAVSASLIGPSFDAFVAENSSEQNRARVFGISQSLFMIVTVIGPVLGGWLAEAYGFKTLLAVAAGFYLVAAFIRIGMARRAARSTEAHLGRLSFSGLKTNLGTMAGLLLAGGVVTWILITDGVRDIAFGLSGNLLPIYMDEIGGMTLRQIGFLNSVLGVFMMASSLAGGWLSDRIGERACIALGMANLGLGLWFMVTVPVGNVWIYACAWAVAGLGVGVMGPAYQSLISKVVPREVRGTAFGLFSTSLGLVSLPAPWLGAQLWERVSPRFPFTIAAVLTLLSIVPVWLKFKLPGNRAGPPADAAAADAMSGSSES
jgi:MFS family permease